MINYIECYIQNMQIRNHRFTQRLSAEENIKDYGIEQLLPNIHMLQR